MGNEITEQDKKAYWESVKGNISNKHKPDTFKELKNVI